MQAGQDQIASRLAEAWRTRRQVDLNTLTPPQSEAEAYALQDKVFATRFPGQRVRAWKAGAGRPDAQPVGAPIGAVTPSPAVLPSGDFHMFGVEAEIAFRIGRDLTTRANAWTEDELGDSIGEVLVAIELCDTRLADWKSAPPLWRLADFQLNGALVVGSGTRDWRELDFAMQRAELHVNGALKVAKTGSHPMGSPMRVLPWAVEHCARRTGGLKAGDLVTTGSWTGMEFVAPGDALRAVFPGIGEASLKIG
jgi:2-keto-4-pentenoate hydratase